MKHLIRFAFSLVAILALATVANAQVTTGSLAGKVQNEAQAGVSGASVIAIHLPSGTTYETTTRSDGRFMIVNMRVGGPYSVTVAYSGTGTAAFAPETQDNVEVNLGVATDLSFDVKNISVTETVTVTAQSDTVFSSGRTGAATSVNRETLATLPTVRGLISDFTRLTPQTSGSNSFGGADSRMNNMTVNGAAFNNSFGLGGQPGERTGVAPISLEAIEQVQVSIAPYDVRQGNFVGASVDTITRSGTNALRASVYHRFRNEDFVGTEARGLVYNPGTFETTNTGVWAGAPIVKNRMFVFGSYENEEDARPLSSFRTNSGGEPVGGSVTRVLTQDMADLSAFLKSSFGYETGSFDPTTDLTPQKRGMVRTDLNINNSNKFSFNYLQLDSRSDVQLSGSTSAGVGRRSVATDHMNYSNSNYQVLENRKTTTGELNSVLGSTMANSLRVTYSSSDESRPQSDVLFPFVDILNGAGSTAYISFGSEPFTPNNELRYKSFEVKNDFTKFSAKHELTFGGRIEKYDSDNVFFNCCKQGAWVYNTLADFYTDARDALANPNRTVSPVSSRYQVRYMNIPGLDKPSQALHSLYGGAYAQDVWRPKTNLSITAGLRFDVPVFENTAYNNPNANALTFRDEDGQPVQYDSGKMPGANILWSPRLGFNYDMSGDMKTQIRGGTGVFTGQPLYVWISNQLGNTGVLQGSLLNTVTTTNPFSTNVDKYKPTNVTGAPAASYELNVTDNDFRFPQVWRTNIAVDRRLPGGITGTAEFMYNRDVNGIYYINANLPAAQAAYTGADTRPRYTNNRINNVTGNQVTSAIVLKNQDIGRNWNLAFSASKPMWHGLSLRTAYSYGEAKNTIDPGSTAGASWNSNPTPSDPNNPGLGYSSASPGHRFFLSASYTKRYFSWGATSVSAFWESRTIGNTSYVFAADANGDGGSSNDLIYIPRNTSEMNFVTFTTGGNTFTAEQQATAFEAYIAQDKYLSAHRGEYAERGAVFLPLLHRMDVSLTQDVFKDIKGKKNAGQFRIDLQNFGNLLNSDWGASQRVIRNNILTTPTLDAQGRLAYRMQVVNNQLVSKSYESTAGLGDVFQFMLSFRYSFN